LAVNRAKSHSVSVIHGPPGTGKTFTLASIVNILSLEEQGTILVCAPSNFAADGIASSIRNLATTKKLGKNVLRIYSKSKESNFSETAREDTHEQTVFDSLHLEVRKTNEWKDNQKLVELWKSKFTVHFRIIILDQYFFMFSYN